LASRRTATKDTAQSERLFGFSDLILQPEVSDERFDKLGLPKTSLFVTDAHGIQKWRSPLLEKKLEISVHNRERVYWPIETTTSTAWNQLREGEPSRRTLNPIRLPHISQIVPEKMNEAASGRRFCSILTSRPR